MAVIAAVLSFVFAGRLDGVREGTVIAALLVGFIARLFGKKFAFVKTMLFPETVQEEQQREQVAQTQHGIQGKNVIRYRKTVWKWRPRYRQGTCREAWL